MADRPMDWPAWIASEEGKRCANLSTLSAGKRNLGEFLENRLWAAFVAGAKYERDKVDPDHTCPAVVGGPGVCDCTDLDKTEGLNPRGPSHF